MPKQLERFRWAATQMKLKGDELILEIGCGTGLLAQEIRENLSTGHLTAIDQSSTMITLARKRFQNLDADNKLTLRVCDFSAFEMNHSFDIIVSFNVSLFWKSPQEELEKIHLLLRPGGRFFIFHQAPFRIDMDYAQPLIDNLTAANFQVDGVTIKKIAPNSAVCVMARAD